MPRTLRAALALGPLALFALAAHAQPRCLAGPGFRVTTTAADSAGQAAAGTLESLLNDAAAPCRFVVRVEGQGAFPVADLADRFGPTGTGALGVAWPVSARGTVELRAQGYRFPKGTLRLLPDSTRDVDPDSVAVSLALVGGSVVFRQGFAAVGPLVPHLLAGGGFYHWVGRREPYPGAGAPEVSRQAQWSGALHAGAGADVPFGRRLALSLEGAFNLVPGELYGASNLRLANVRTFGFVTAHVGLQVGF